MIQCAIRRALRARGLHPGVYGGYTSPHLLGFFRGTRKIDASAFVVRSVEEIGTDSWYRSLGSSNLARVDALFFTVSLEPLPNDFRSEQSTKMTT
jgi:hypothetical protein